MADIQRSTLACRSDCSNGIIVGDFGWKRSCDAAVGNQWTLVPMAHTVKTGGASPTRCLHRGSSRPPTCWAYRTISAHNIRAKWAVVWRRVPEGSGHADARREQAARAGLTLSQSANGTCPPARGGFHGWTKPKLQALLAHAPRILHELHALFVRTVGTYKF